MIDLDAFLPEINPKAPGCPAPTAYQAILQATDVLCTRLKIWRYTDTLPVQDLDAIDFDPPDGSELIDFESVFFGDTQLEPKDVGWLDMAMRGWRRGAIEGLPRFYAQTDMNTLRITPVDTGILTVNCWLKPSMDADELPDFLYQRYHEVIAYGALGRILSTPNQPFTDLQMGASYFALFEQKLASESWRGIIGQQRALPRSRGSYM